MTQVISSYFTLRLPSEVWRDLIFIKYLSYTDILNFMKFIRNKTILYKQFIEYAFEEYQSLYIEPMVLYLRNILLIHKLEYNNTVITFILNDTDILLNILRHHTSDMTCMNLNNIIIKKIDTSDIAHILDIYKSSIDINDFRIDIYNIYGIHSLFMLTYNIKQTNIVHSMYGPTNIRWYSNGIKHREVYYKNFSEIIWDINGNIISQI